MARWTGSVSEPCTDVFYALLWRKNIDLWHFQVSTFCPYLHFALLPLQDAIGLSKRSVQIETSSLFYWSVSHFYSRLHKLSLRISAAVARFVGVGDCGHLSQPPNMQIIFCPKLWTLVQYFWLILTWTYSDRLMFKYQEKPVWSIDWKLFVIKDNLQHLHCYGSSEVSTWSESEVLWLEADVTV